MSYTYLQGPGAESSADNFSAIEPFVRSKLNLTAEKSCCNGNGTESCRGSRSGMTCEHSTGGRGVELSMSSAAGSHARISAQPERVPASTANDPDSGAKWPASLAKYDPDSRLWKTRQCLLLGGLEEFSETFPRWGSMHSGELYRQPTPALRTCGKGSGFWPTPRASDGPKGGNGPNSRDMSLTQAVKMWPTPDTRGFTNDGAIAALAQVCETMDELSGMTHRAGKAKKTRIAAKFYPTPQASDHRNRGNMDTPAIARRVESGKQITLTMTVSGGQLNPDWVEWLMKWPIAWTALKPLETGRFRQWLRSHGGSYQELEVVA